MQPPTMIRSSVTSGMISEIGAHGEGTAPAHGEIEQDGKPVITAGIAKLQPDAEAGGEPDADEQGQDAPLLGAWIRNGV